MARSSTGPWFRSSKNAWYATVAGRKINLKVKGESNEAEAQKAWHRLMAGLPVDAAKSDKPQQHAAQDEADSPTVASVIAAFLADCEGRLKPSSVVWYTDLLKPFATQGERQGERITDYLSFPTSRIFSR